MTENNSATESEMLRLERDTLQRELNATKDKLAEAKRLLEVAQPLVATVPGLEAAVRIQGKKLTIIEGLLWDWYYTKNGWTKFWSTGALLNKIREAIYSQES